jgi:hypothetical protein
VCYFYVVTKIKYNKPYVIIPNPLIMEHITKKQKINNTQIDLTEAAQVLQSRHSDTYYRQARIIQILSNYLEELNNCALIAEMSFEIKYAVFSIEYIKLKPFGYTLIIRHIFVEDVPWTVKRDDSNDMHVPISDKKLKKPMKELDSAIFDLTKPIEMKNSDKCTILCAPLDEEEERIWLMEYNQYSTDLSALRNHLKYDTHHTPECRYILNHFTSNNFPECISAQRVYVGSPFNERSSLLFFGRFC